MIRPVRLDNGEYWTNQRIDALANTDCGACSGTGEQPWGRCQTCDGDGYLQDLASYDG